MWDFRRITWRTTWGDRLKGQGEPLEKKTSWLVFFSRGLPVRPDSYLSGQSAARTLLNDHYSLRSYYFLAWFCVLRGYNICVIHRRFYFSANSASSAVMQL